MNNMFVPIYIILAGRYLTYIHKKLIEFNEKKWGEVRERYILLIAKTPIMVFILLGVSAIIGRLLEIYFEFIFNYIT